MNLKFQIYHKVIHNNIDISPLVSSLFCCLYGSFMLSLSIFVQFLTESSVFNFFSESNLLASLLILSLLYVGFKLWASVSSSDEPRRYCCLVCVPGEFRSKAALAVVSIRAGMDDGQRRAVVFPGEQRGGGFSVDRVLPWLDCCVPLPLKMRVLISTPQCDALKVEPLEWDQDPLKETQRESLFLLPCELTVRRWLLRIWRGFSPGHQICRHRELGLPSLWTIISKLPLFEPLSLWYFVIAAPSRLRHTWKSLNL